MYYKMLIITILIFTTTHCFANDDSVKPQNDTFKYSIYRPELKRAKSVTGTKAIARLLFKDYLGHYKASNIDKSERLKAYKILAVKIIEEDTLGFIFTVDFSVQSFNESLVNWSAGNGRVSKNNWVVNKSNFVWVKKERNKYIVKEIGTGP
ncbi:MAG: hypothetical protein Q8O74_09340 [bacterium]|nr:hypothetical protein [bacterium]